MKLFVLLSVLASLALQTINGIPLTDFYSYGPDAGDTTLARGEESSSEIQLLNEFSFYGTRYSSLYVNANGVLMFGEALNSSLSVEEMFPSDKPLIAPFWTNYDNHSPTARGHTYFRVSRSDSDINKVNQHIPTEYRISSLIHSVLVVTWENLHPVENPNMTNTFQCILAMSDALSHVTIHYGDELMQWAGSPYAQVGMNAGDQNNSFTIPNSNTESVLEITQTSNSGSQFSQGLWSFLFMSQNVQMPGVIVSWAKAEYEVEEDIGSTLVCVNVTSGRLTGGFVITAIPVRKTAGFFDYPLDKIQFTFDAPSTSGEDSNVGACARLYIIDDTTFEDEEYFQLQLLDVEGAVSQRVAIVPRLTDVRIQDNDIAVVEHFTPTVTVSENQARVSLCAVLKDTESNDIKSQKALKVAYSTQPGTAIDNRDFLPVINGEIEFPYGTVKSCGDVEILNDNAFENDEDFYFSFSQIVAQDRVVIDTSINTVTVKDDDASSVTVELDQTSYTVTEGESFTACVQITAGNRLAGSFNVTLQTRYPAELIQGNVVSANNVDDFIGKIKVLNFNPSNAAERQCITVQTVEDVLYENEEIFGFVLSTSDGVSLPLPRVTIFLEDNDYIQISLTQKKFNFREGQDRGEIRICANRTGQIQRRLTVTVLPISDDGTVTIEDGSRTGDVVLPIKDITFMPEESLACTSITILDDYILETPVETFNVSLSHPDSYVQFLVDTTTIAIHDNDQVRISFFRNPNKEVAEDDTTIPTICIRRSGLSAIPVSVSLEPVNGTATAMLDYEATGDKAIFPIYPNIQMALECPSVSLTIFDDPIVEGDEDILLQLFSDEPERIVVTDSNGDILTAVITIKENDVVIVSFMQQSLSVSEGDGGVDVCLTMKGFTILPFTVYISTWQDTAREGIDFLPQTVAIHFPPTNQTLIDAIYQLNPADRVGVPHPNSDPECARISIIDDDVLEGIQNKLFLLNVETNETYVRLEAPQSVIVTVNDNDHVMVVLETSEIVVSEGEGTVRVCSRLVGTADFDISAQLQTSQSSAVDGLDFTGDIGYLVFPAFSEDLQCFQFSITDDHILENSEEFFVELRITEANRFVIAGGNLTCTVIIEDNDFVEVEFEQREYSPVENDEAITVCAQLVGQTDRDISVLFSTRTSPEGALATVNVDYIEIINTTLFEGVFMAPQTSQCISITLIDDSILENTESFQVSLHSFDGGVQINELGVANVYILDDDGVRMGIQRREYRVDEEQRIMPICVELIGQIERSINVVLSTQSVTAAGGRDFEEVSSVTLQFIPISSDEQLICSNFIVIDDSIYEGTEIFFVHLEIDNRAVSVHIPKATVYINDNDMVSVEFQSIDDQVTEGDGQVEVCLVLDSQTEINVTCSVSTEPDSATQDEEPDYVFDTPQLVVFPPSTSGGLQCIYVDIIDDVILEATEQFAVVASSEMPRVSVFPNSSNIDIADNDRVSVGFTQVLFNVSEDMESEQDVTICIELVGKIERSVIVMATTESSSGFQAVASSVNDYVPIETFLTFHYEQENKTHCITVTVLDDRFVERIERFDVVLTSDDPGVVLMEDKRRAVVVITDEDVVCGEQGVDTSRGFFDWPEAFPNEVVRLPCVNGSAIRVCGAKGNWEIPHIDDCYATIDAIIKHVFTNLPTDDGGLSKEALKELIAALLRLKDENPGRLGKFLGSIVDLFETYSVNVDSDVVTVDSEIFGLIIDVVDILHFPEWPKHMVQEHSVRLVKSVETVTEGLLKPEEFQRLRLDDTFMGFYGEKGPKKDVSIGKTVVFERHPVTGTTSRILPAQSSDVIGPNFLSSISLPSSIVELVVLDLENVRVFFSFFETSVMFPLVNSTDFSVTNGSHAVSAVIAATFSQTQIEDLKDPLNYTIYVDQSLNYSNPVCVSWNYSALGGQGNWTNAGCKLLSDKSRIITCSCTHLTNFAILLDIRTRAPELSVVPALSSPLSNISIVGVAISLLGLVLTVVTLLIFSKLRKKDSTVLRIQLCISLALMLLAFICGIERIEIFEVCVTISALIHYFSLVAMMWMAAETLLMFQKLIVMFTKTSVPYFVIVSLVCWLLPIPAVVVPIGIDRNFSIHEKFCFISHHIVFYAAFLGPVAAILIFTLVIFLLSFIVILRHSTTRFRDTEKASTRKGAIWTMFTILCVLTIFGLTWVFGALTVQGTQDSPFEYLFVIFNSLQGFFIFIFFVILAKETRDLWLQTCGCKKPSLEEKIGETASVSRVPSLRKTHRMTSVDSLGSFDYDGADRLEALKALDKEARLNMNSWDVMYVMPQNTFDIFLNSDQFQSFYGGQQNNGPSPLASAALPDSSHLEDESTVDSGILIDQSKPNSIQSPLKLGGQSLDTPENRKSHHVHSVSGIGYVSADSSDDDGLAGGSSPSSSPLESRYAKTLATANTDTDMNTHTENLELGIVMSDYQLHISP